MGKSSRVRGPAATKEKGKGKVEESVVSPRFVSSPRQGRKTSSDCGVYKHIEAQLLGMDLTLVNDDNIREARHKIAYDLWEAANDPELISRMEMFVPQGYNFSYG
ncbi:hypothetical protein Bca52824_063719 [Brassica carinata]|uniref:Ubiquitin-like protease family profile domain-containing protein n=1 Tax=Brassica carinata TaxID=52824 RepID=A0A8X7QEW2_BRACI|nr:hypothetical protein Bca52824_063719 [Brassica carinata]